MQCPNSASGLVLTQDSKRAEEEKSCCAGWWRSTKLQKTGRI